MNLLQDEDADIRKFATSCITCIDPEQQQFMEHNKRSYIHTSIAVKRFYQFIGSGYWWSPSMFKYLLAVVLGKENVSDVLSAFHPG